MLDLVKTIDFVKKNFYEKKSIDPCYDFFYSSILINIMSLEIASASYSNNCLSFEMLCKKKATVLPHVFIISLRKQPISAISPAFYITRSCASIHRGGMAWKALKWPDRWWGGGQMLQTRRGSGEGAGRNHCRCAMRRHGRSRGGSPHPIRVVTAGGEVRHGVRAARNRT